ncbi:MAG: DUF1656 domain-containing protein [Burkholderiaceae bacterium]
MMGEIDIAGIYFSPLLLCVLLGLIARVLISKVLEAAGVYRHIWRRPLFDTALFFILIGAAFLLLNALTSPTP